MFNTSIDPFSRGFIRFLLAFVVSASTRRLRYMHGYCQPTVYERASDDDDHKNRIDRERDKIVPDNLPLAYVVLISHTSMCVCVFVYPFIALIRN
jgi:hypothetical protein